ncbi:MAG: rod shape-determining protein MreC [Bacteroidetes bacterium]|nr:MAG: rod shape-determining protein MreC [Bacteroidota bacterium]
MKLLFLILTRYQTFIVFCLLEAIGFWLILSNNSYQNAALFVNANHLFANVQYWNSEMAEYLSLKEKNEKLQQENAKLRSQMSEFEIKSNTSPIAIYKGYIPAKVVSNSIWKSDNYLLLNKGRADGVLPGMGVVSSTGVVGKVKECSEHFSTVFSLLHSQMSISSRMKKLRGSKSLCITRWLDHSNYTMASLTDLPLHLDVKTNDTIVTSGYGTVFPGSYMLGKVKTVGRQTEEGVKIIDIELSTDFSDLVHVYIINAQNQSELDSLDSPVPVF